MCLGHSDGLRIDPSTHLLWATSCEDGKTFLTASNPNLDKNGNNVFPALDTITLSGVVVEGSANSTFWLSTSHFSTSTIYTQTPDDSGVVGLVGVIDPSTGFVTPIAIGFGKATGMIFVPDSQS